MPALSVAPGGRDPACIAPGFWGRQAGGLWGACSPALPVLQAPRRLFFQNISVGFNEQRLQCGLPVAAEHHRSPWAAMWMPGSLAAPSLSLLLECSGTFKSGMPQWGEIGLGQRAIDHLQ